MSPHFPKVIVNVLLFSKVIVNVPLFLNPRQTTEHWIHFFFVGSSKKKAKHAAAQNALNLIQGIPNGQAGAGGDASTNSM